MFLVHKMIALIFYSLLCIICRLQESYSFSQQANSVLEQKLKTAVSLTEVVEGIFHKMTTK